MVAEQLLASWNDTGTRASITDFVTAATDGEGDAGPSTHTGASPAGSPA